MSSSEKHSVVKNFDFHVGSNPQIDVDLMRYSHQEFKTRFFSHPPRNDFPFYLLSRKGLHLLIQELKDLVRNYSYVCYI